MAFKNRKKTVACLFIIGFLAYKLLHPFCSMTLLTFHITFKHVKLQVKIIVFLLQYKISYNIYFE